MPKTALLFGSIGTIAETSDIQRQAYNAALAEAGLDWLWDVATYSDLLDQSGGKDRLTTLSAATAAGLSAATIDRIHARKTEIACAMIGERAVGPRPGVVELLTLARQRGLKTGFVTTTYQPNIDAILATLGDRLGDRPFDVIVSRADVTHGKPSPDAFLHALTTLDVDAAAALAIEDTAISLMAAKRAGIVTIATPGALTAQQDFWQADLVVAALADAAGTIDPRVAALLG